MREVARAQVTAGTEPAHDAAVGAADAGAAIVHLHARDPKTGQPTQDPAYFREFAADIKTRSDVVINFTTGGSPTMGVEERLQPALQLKPEVASLNMGSMNFGFFPVLDKIKSWQFPRPRGTGVVLVTGLTGAVFATAVAAGGAGTSTFTVMWWMTAAVGLVALLVSPRVRRV